VQHSAAGVEDHRNDMSIRRELERGRDGDTILTATRVHDRRANTGVVILDLSSS
jgi:hypothetical protein